MDYQIDKLLHGGQFKSMLNEQWEGLRKKYSLKKVDIEVLLFLAKSEKNTARDIQTYLKFNKGYLSQILDNLSQKGYITAKVDRSDRRYVHYELTEEALKITDEANEICDKVNKRLFANLTQNEIETLKEASKKIYENIQDIIKNGL